MIDRNILIVAEALAERLETDDWVAVDCRFDLSEPEAGRALYEQGHLPGAVFLDLDRDLSAQISSETGRHPLPSVNYLVERLESLGIGSQHRIAVYDSNHGALAARAWWILRWLGHENAYLLDGGFDRWQESGCPVEKTVVRRPRASFEPRVRHDLVLTTAELAADVDAIPSFRLLDARDRARFRGEEEPIDAVAGHIPGATSAPFGDFVHTDGRWKDLAERRAMLLAALGEDGDTPWSVMCGSGVTACHLAITGIEAGLTEPRVYVGSWSEWIRDESRPIRRGDD